jgi:hypothetical protein
MEKAVTYNFDPEKWFDLQEAALRAKLASGELDEGAFKEALDRLVDEYEKLLARVDIRCEY